jgi:beta-galactosidase/beta-glucuronidase
MIMTIPRPEYPRPQFQRSHWLNLNGEWQFDFDDADCGLIERWYDAHNFSRSILVPFAYQAPLSGIGTNDIHDVVWYRRVFSIPDSWAGQHIHLHFEAVDYHATVWVNGILAVVHEGGHTPFSVDVTRLLNPSDNSLVVRAADITSDRGQPRGKQYWERDSAAIFYTRTTGIWQTVWMEPVPDLRIDHLKLIPQLEDSSLRIEYQLAGNISSSYQIVATIHSEGKPIVADMLTTDGSSEVKTWGGDPYVQSHTLTFPADSSVQRWSPESPHLYDLTLQVKRDEQVVDTVQSYFGMRSVQIEDGKLLLNGAPYYLKFVLDQGYHPEGILTFPSDEAIRHDIELTKAMGFNGARKHQKVEEARFLYWADKMGLLVWGEMANCYLYSEAAIQRVAQEWQVAVRRDYNHPCIMVWVPLNESWGVPNLLGDARQAQHLVALYALTRSIDPTRPVISNDGWEHARTDLLTIHDYEGSGDILRGRYATLESILAAQPAKRVLTLPGHEYTGQPILLTEFGGIGYRKGAQQGWGYTTAENDEDFIQRYRAVVEAVYSSPHIQGFCYTQLTDVEQEINGLLTYDRQPKVPVEVIRQINDSR